MSELYFEKHGKYDVNKQYVWGFKEKGTTVPKVKPYEDKGTYTK